MPESAIVYLPLPLMLALLSALVVVTSVEAGSQKNLLHVHKVAASSRYRIFTYWDYPYGPGELVKLNIRTWQRHAPPGTEIVFVNNSNFCDLVPDCPKEWFRLPYPAANSDVVRAAVLYHQGGLYMDTDFMVGSSLAPVFAKLDEGWDAVAYSQNPGTSGKMSGNEEVSSNFMAGRKGNSFSRTWWTNIKAKLTRTCGEGEMTMEKVCCREAFATHDEPEKCHIPWAQLEHLKFPTRDHDLHKLKVTPSLVQQRLRTSKEASVAHDLNNADVQAVLAEVEYGNRKAEQLPADVKVYCFRGNEGLAPHLNGEVYWQPWDSHKGMTGKPLGMPSAYDSRFACQATSDKDLKCDRGNWGEVHRDIENFFGRMAYHLFFSTRKCEAESQQEVLDRNWLLSELYRQSLGL